MALTSADRVWETSTTSGTGTLNLAGPLTGFQSFVAGIGTTNKCYYSINEISTGSWETGIGTVTSGSPNTLSRSVLASSNSNALVSFTGTTLNVVAGPVAEGVPELDDGRGSGLAGQPVAFLDSAGRILTKGTSAGSALVKVARSSNTQLLAANQSNWIVATSSFTQTFDTAANLGSGWFVVYQNGGTGAITTTTDGQTYAILPGEIRVIQSDGSSITSYIVNPFTVFFTSTGTFIDPPGYRLIGFKGIGSTGGGGGGSTSTGGGGSGGAGIKTGQYTPTAGTSRTVTIDTGGAGGAATVDGTVGGNSSIQNVTGATFFPGLPGLATGDGGNGGGSSTTGEVSVINAFTSALAVGVVTNDNLGTGGGLGTANHVGGNAEYGGGGGGSGNTATPGSAGGGSIFAGAAGGGGGGAASAGGAGGRTNFYSVGGGAAGGTASTTGNTGTAGTAGSLATNVPGSGGGGGGDGTAGAGGVGGAGAAPGGGAGGGGRGTTAGGAGGAGARGEIMIWGIA